MFSRIWTLLLALAVGAALAGVFVVTGERNELAEEESNVRRVRDLLEAERALADGAAQQMRAVSALELPESLAAALRTDRRAPEVEPGAFDEALGALDEQLGDDEDRLFAVDAAGEVVAELGAESLEGVDVRELPALNAALGGLVESAVMVHQGRALRVVARPVTQEDRLVGAIAHARPLDLSLAAERAPDAAIVLFQGSELLAFAAPRDARSAPDEATVKRALGALGQGVEKGRAETIGLNGR